MTAPVDPGTLGKGFMSYSMVYDRISGLNDAFVLRGTLHQNAKTEDERAARDLLDVFIGTQLNMLSELIRYLP